MVGNDEARDVLFQLLVHVHQGRRSRDPFLDGEAEPVGLSGAVVGILAKDDDLGLLDVEVMGPAKIS